MKSIKLFKVIFTNLVLATVLSCSFTGCSNDNSTSQSTNTASQETTQPKKHTGPMVNKETCGVNWENQFYIFENDSLQIIEPWQRCFQREGTLDDKEFWSEPRIMFVKKKPDYKDQRVNPSIFSMRLDGTDIRLVLRWDELAAGDNGNMYHKPVRSPDNRYIAYSYVTDGQFSKMLYDIREHKRIKLIDGGAKSNFIWTPDSENLIFYVDDDMKNYHLPTQIMTDRPFVYSSGGSLYLLEDGKTFMAARYSRLDFSDFQGNKIKTIKLPHIDRENHDKWDFEEFFPYNKYFYYSNNLLGYVYDIEKQEVVYTYPDDRKSPVSGVVIKPMSTKYMFNSRKDGGYVEHDFSTNERKVLIPNFSISLPTLINYKPGDK